jgi:hypothetical protein
VGAKATWEGALRSGVGIGLSAIGGAFERVGNELIGKEAAGDALDIKSLGRYSNKLSDWRGGRVKFRFCRSILNS